MTLARIFYRSSPRRVVRVRGSWSQKWAAFLLDRRETATQPMDFDWLSN